MRLTKIIDISFGSDPDKCGEVLRSLLNSKDFFGYYTFILDTGWVEEALDVRADIVPMTLFMGCDAKTEGTRMQKARNDELALTVWWGYDHDGTIVFQSDEGWMLYNSDCKKSHGWEWVDDDCWVNDLPEDYYDYSSITLTTY